MTSPRERPIIFSGPMVRAILDGRKTQTRRVVSPQPAHSQVHAWHRRTIYDGEHRMWCWRDLVLENLIDFPQGGDRAELTSRCPYGSPGDRLWVREGWQLAPNGVAIFRADDAAGHIDSGWKSPIFTPRAVSRLLLEVTGVRVQRLHEISEEDACAEGVRPHTWGQWWQGYRDLDGDGKRLIHQDVGPMAEPPAWMIEPHPLDMSHLDTSARLEFSAAWNGIHAKDGRGWDANPWVWAITFRRLEPS